jgi:hypothetical protein
MTTVSLVSGTDRLTPSEIEGLHIRLATHNSLNDTNINTEGIISDILLGRSEPVPLYTSTSGGAPDDQIRTQINLADPDLWDSVFKVISNGQIEALDQFVKLGLDVTHIHPRRSQYPVFHAVKCAQTNMMRHLINLGADVNTWSATVISWDFNIPRYDTPDHERARTPLMCAAEQGNLNICKILCESAFADPMLIAPDGQTAQRLAARNGHREIVQYLPAHRGGSLLRLKCMLPRSVTCLILDDYNHRWRFIRVALHGIYVFLKVTFYEIPKFLIITLPWEILKETKRGIVRLYKSIPPIRAWPRIVKDAVVAAAKGIKKFLIALGNAIKATPRAIYDGGKYLAKKGKNLAIKTWKGIKALPGLMKIGLQKTWAAIKAIASWVKDLLLEYSLPLLLWLTYQYSLPPPYRHLRHRRFLPQHHHRRHHPRLQSRPSRHLRRLPQTLVDGTKGSRSWNSRYSRLLLFNTLLDRVLYHLRLGLDRFVCSQEGW